MQIYLNKVALEEAHRVLRGELGPIPQSGRIIDAVIRAYLAVAAEPGFSNSGWKARYLAKMKVGEVSFTDGTKAGVKTWGSTKETARHLMGNSLANWRLRAVLTGEIRIERTVDGVKTHNEGRSRSTTAHQLARMRVDDSILLEARGKLEVYFKQSARVILGDAKAEWKSLRVPGGLRVRRTR